MSPSPTDDDAAARITVRHLLTHTSGLQQWASRTDRFDNTADGLTRSVEDLATVTPSGPPGAAHECSDANYMVLGALVASVTGQPFGAVLHDQIFAPLGMSHAAADAAGADQVGLSPGHRMWFGRPHRFDRGYDTSGVPYGYLVASPDDMARFLMAQLGGGDRVLSVDGIAQMHTGQVATGGAVVGPRPHRRPRAHRGVVPDPRPQGGPAAEAGPARTARRGDHCVGRRVLHPGGHRHGGSPVIAGGRSRTGPAVGTRPRLGLGDRGDPGRRPGGGEDRRSRSDLAPIEGPVGGIQSCS